MECTSIAEKHSTQLSRKKAMKAMILAAGHGTRMRPLTDHTPKPLLEVAGKPLIIWHIENLKQAGFQEIVINIAWLGYKISDALGDGSQFGVKLVYSDEQQEGALETAGGIIKALPLLGDTTFLVVNGDVWCDYQYSINDPLKNEDLAHIILVSNPEHNEKGDFSLNQQRVANEGINKLTFSGVGYYHPTLFNQLKEGKRPLAPLLREAIAANRISGELFSGDWFDIGTPKRLDNLNKKLTKKT